MLVYIDVIRATNGHLIALAFMGIVTLVLIPKKTYVTNSHAAGLIVIETIPITDEVLEMAVSTVMAGVRSD